MKKEEEEIYVEPKKINMTEVCHNVADSIMNNYVFKTIPSKKDDEIWVYDEGIYKPIGRSLIKAKVEQRLGKLCKTYNVNEIINKVARKTYIQREKFQCKDIDLVCVNNGVLNIKTKKLLSHSPDYNFVHKLPVDYIPNAFCYKIFEFISEVFDEDDMLAIQEWIGYQLHKEYFIKKAAIFRGIPNTGKTTFMNLMVAFVGKENVSSVSLQMLAQGKWHLTELFNKYSNICDDLSEKDVVDSGTFKQVTGRSPLQAEYKFGDQFNFVNHAKLSFACNKIPVIKTDVDDEAYWDRWLIFDFENVFDKHSRGSKKMDTHIVDKITSPDELSGLLNWALVGLDRLKEQGYFSYKRTWEDNRKIMQGEANNVARFNNECLMYEVDGWVSNFELYGKYQEFCNLNGLTSQTDQVFWKEIRNYCNFGKFHNQDKVGKWGVKHIKVREPLPIGGF